MDLPVGPAGDALEPGEADLVDEVRHALREGVGVLVDLGADPDVVEGAELSLEVREVASSVGSEVVGIAKLVVNDHVGDDLLELLDVLFAR